jgi:hypothetical protein
LVGKIRPSAFVDAFRVFAGDLYGLVRAEAVYDDNLGSDACDAFKGGFDSIFFIMGDENRRYLHGRILTLEKN